MKNSERNLLVIENFIDYYTTNDQERDEIKKSAEGYISEDWVDGEGNTEDYDHDFYPIIAEKIANARQQSLESLAEETSRTATGFFRGIE